jgi:ATP-dependent DNA helicase RecG
MSSEGTEFDKKSLRVVTRTNPDWDELACDCVAFANARGGRLLIGIEDEADEPPVGQVVDGSLIEAINKRIPQITINTSIAACKKISGNGGEFIELTVRRNAQTVAATTDGRYFIRVSDESRPLMPDELTLLSGEKNAYVWEVQTTKKVLRNQYDEGKLRDFMAAIQKSDRVSGFVKAKTSEELLDYYFFSSGQYLTNLGILWIGRREDRATLLYAPVIQFIKYDELENKVNKLLWDDFELNPLELIESVWDRVPDWRESYELPDGLFRKNIPQYDELVVRELLANALVHKPYTQRGDIFINLHSDRLEIHNPGLLPLGVTPSNILHATVKRNEHMARIFYDLRLMEREGSGYDRIYEALVTTGRPVPEVREGDDRVMITVRKRILNPAIIDFMFKADQVGHFGRRSCRSCTNLSQGKIAEACKSSGVGIKCGERERRSVRYDGRVLFKHRHCSGRGITRCIKGHLVPEVAATRLADGPVTVGGEQRGICGQGSCEPGFNLFGRHGAGAGEGGVFKCDGTVIP